MTAKFDINIFDLKQKDLINTLIACVSAGKKFNKIIFAFVHYSHDIQFLEEEENKDFYGVAGQNVTKWYMYLSQKSQKFCEFLGFILMEECCLIIGVPLMLR